MGQREPSGAETFELVSHSTRVDILGALADAFAADPTDPFLEYSELRSEVGMGDKGNFNYHLDRLEDLVSNTPEGYAITNVGLQVVSVLTSGSFDTEWTWGPVEVPGDCFFCADSLALSYEDGNLVLTCGTDAHTLVFPVSPSLLDGDSDASTDVLDRVAVSLYRQSVQLRHGICPECQGTVTPELAPEPKPDQGGYYFHGDCKRCGFQHGFPVGVAAISHPTVVACYDAAGIDLRRTPFWTLEWCHVGAETVVSEDPLRLSVEATVSDEQLSITLDRDATVVETERSPSPS